jgi:hypothetical protein
LNTPETGRDPRPSRGPSGGQTPLKREAPVNDLARLTFLPAGSLQDYDQEKLHLHHHLCRLFGVDQLQAVQADLKQMTTAAKSAARKVGEIRRSSKSDAEGWAAELSQLEGRIEAAKPVGAALRSELAKVSAVVAAGEQLERYEAALAPIIHQMIG